MTTLLIIVRRYKLESAKGKDAQDKIWEDRQCEASAVFSP